MKTIKIRFFLLGGVSLLLGGAVTLILIGEALAPAARFQRELGSILPLPPLGWTVKSKPIAETPEMMKAVDELLNYDQGVFVEYTRDDIHLSVYIAYWSPGRMSPRLVAGHNPDVCWVGNGWIKKSGSLLTGLMVDSTILPEVESRLYELNDHKEYVWFWHVVDLDVRPYGDRLRAPWYSAVTDVWSRGLNQRREQFFIRLSSNEPLSSLMKGELLPEILATLPLPAA